MTTADEYVRQSLALHLFFARIMKEHSFFLEVGFMPKDTALSDQADYFRRAFGTLLEDATRLSNGVVSPEVLRSGEVITPYTLSAETATSQLTGIRLQTEITRSEAELTGGGITSVSPALEQQVDALNNNAASLTASLIQFKTSVLSNVLSCRLFTVNYPLLIDHILREAKLYLSMVQSLQRREETDIQNEAYRQETFWNNIMAEHSKFIRGLLDPTEKILINTADNFGNQFDQLTQEAKQAMDKTIPLKKVTDDSLNSTKLIKDFKEAGTKGILECKIRSIIIPLLGDHVLREANHYLRLLNMFENSLSPR